MNVAVVYCCPTVEKHTYLPFAGRFAKTWREHPPGFEHKLFIMVNGTDWPASFQQEFYQIPHHWELNDNTGWDVGAFQRAANVIPCDLMVCLGAHICFNHDNWLRTMAEAYMEHGPGLYGPWGALYPTKHIRTTAFWCPPELLASYPYYVQSDRKSRYQFEHGRESFTAWTLEAGFPCFMVTTRGVWESNDWEDQMPNSEESLVLDRQHKPM